MAEDEDNIVTRIGRLSTFIKLKDENDQTSIHPFLADRIESRVILGSKTAYLASLKANLSVIHSYANGDESFHKLKSSTSGLTGFSTSFVRHCFSPYRTSSEYINRLLLQAASRDSDGNSCGCDVVNHLLLVA